MLIVIVDVCLGLFFEHNRVDMDKGGPNSFTQAIEATTDVLNSAPTRSIISPRGTVRFIFLLIIFLSLWYLTVSLFYDAVTHVSSLPLPFLYHPLCVLHV